MAMVAAVQRQAAPVWRASVRRQRFCLIAVRHLRALLLVLLTACGLELATTGSAGAQAFTYNPRPPHQRPPRVASDGQMLVQAVEVDYD